MSQGARPEVSIGLPVYNGMRYLERAIESILRQTYDNFELIVCDNASTDDTGTICQHYAANDARIRYHRNPSNLGAAANFNLTFALSTGRYFKWAAHDDVLEPDFLERCVAALEAHPDAVLSHSLVALIDQHGKRLAVYDSRIWGTDRPRQSVRLGGRLSTSECVEVFGLIRAEALRGGPLIAEHIGSDWTLLADLALRGRFLIIPEVLFLNREHIDRGSRPGMDLRERHAWYASDRGRPKASHSWLMLTTCAQLIRRHVTDPMERLRCYSHLSWWLLLRGRIVRVALEPLLAAHPRLFRLMFRLRAAAISTKNRFLGADG